MIKLPRRWSTLRPLWLLRNSFVHQLPNNIMNVSVMQMHRRIAGMLDRLKVKSAETKSAESALLHSCCPLSLQQQLRPNSNSGLVGSVILFFANKQQG